MGLKTIKSRWSEGEGNLILVFLAKECYKSLAKGPIKGLKVNDKKEQSLKNDFAEELALKKYEQVESI